MKERNSYQEVPLKLLVILQILMTFIALLLIYIFLEPGLSQIILSGRIMRIQLVYGLLAGIILIAPVIFYAYKWPKDLAQSLDILLPVCRKPLYVLAIISFLAGLGEEFLFRAFLQELLGLWPASLLFMLAHAGFWAAKPHTKTRVLFAPFSLGAALLLGILYSQIGLMAAITAHAFYDYLAFWFIKEKFASKRA